MLLTAPQATYGDMHLSNTRLHYVKAGTGQSPNPNNYTKISPIGCQCQDVWSTSDNAIERRALTDVQVCGWPVLKQG